MALTESLVNGLDIRLVYHVPPQAASLGIGNRSDYILLAAKGYCNVFRYDAAPNKGTCISYGGQLYLASIYGQLKFGCSMLQ